MKREDITKNALLGTIFMGIPSGGLLLYTLNIINVSFYVSIIITLLYLLTLFLKLRQDNIIEHLKDKK